MSRPSGDWTVLSMLEWTTDYFKSRGIPDPRHSIEWLLAEVLDVKRLDLYLQFDRPLTQKELDRLRPLVKRRAEHEPLQYIIGYTEFMNARICVGPEVLIPRIETEQLVELILEDHPDEKSVKHVLDIGTGSGCIPIALKQERNQWKVSSFDISEDALRMAQKNAEQNDVTISFWKADILNWEEMKIETEFDIIVSNPPYVLPDEKESLDRQVVEHEPDLALFSENLEEIYGSIIRFAERHLSENGTLYLELHELHAQEISELFNPEKWNAEIEKDYEKKSRFIRAKRQI